MVQCPECHAAVVAKATAEFDGDAAYITSVEGVPDCGHHS